MVFAARSAPARTLAEDLHRFIEGQGFPLATEFPEAVTPIVERLALRGIDLPVPAAAPAFTYTFNFELGAPERSSNSLGPVFADRADTVGRRRLAIGVSYLHADLTRFNGSDFADSIVTKGRVPGLGRQGFEASDFRLTTDDLYVSGTYGVTDDIDVNLLVPITRTALQLTGRSLAKSQFFVARQTATLDESAVGVGDVLLRSKWRFFHGPVDAASTLALRLPSGQAENFHGLGDTILETGVIASRTLSVVDLHGSIGIELDMDDFQRNRFRYSAGVTFQPWERLAFIVDVVGSSAIVDDEFTIAASPASLRFGSLFGNDALIESRRRNDVLAAVPRYDVVDVAAAVKGEVAPDTALFIGAIVPANQSGLRPWVVPTVGVEHTF